MPERPLQFDLYRLQIVDDPTMFPFMGRPIRTDDDIERVLERASSSDFDRTNTSGRTTYRWSLRESVIYADGHDGAPRVAGLTLARSVVSQIGQTVTDSSIEDAVSQVTPPTAQTLHLFFNLNRHLVGAEYNSDVMSSELWRSSLHEIIDAAAHSVEFRSGLRIEPVPRDAEILTAFRSFSILTRFRVRLRIPNPELSRFTAKLRAEMEGSQIREYTQDMRNPNGLSQREEGLPFASAAMAQDGYKDGEVLMTGMREGKRTTVRTGRRAARGRVEGLKSFVRGMASIARTREARAAVTAIMEEIDRIAEPPVQ